MLKSNRLTLFALVIIFLVTAGRSSTAPSFQEDGTEDLDERSAEGEGRSDIPVDSEVDPFLMSDVGDSRFDLGALISDAGKAVVTTIGNTVHNVATFAADSLTDTIRAVSHSVLDNGSDLLVKGARGLVDVVSGHASQAKGYESMGRANKGGPLAIGDLAREAKEKQAALEQTADEAPRGLKSVENHGIGSSQIILDGSSGNNITNSNTIINSETGHINNTNFNHNYSTGWRNCRSRRSHYSPKELVGSPLEIKDQGKFKTSSTMKSKELDGTVLLVGSSKS